MNPGQNKESSVNLKGGHSGERGGNCKKKVGEGWGHQKTVKDGKKRGTQKA